MSENLSANEIEALDWLKSKGGEVLITSVPDKNERDHIGVFTPGLTLFKKLAKKGLVYFTIEDPLVLDDGTEFEFTQAICLGDGS